MRSSNELAVRLEGVSKRFYLNPKRPWRLRDLVARPRTLLRQILPREPFWAIRDLTLDVKRGEIVGVIGPNGSGKSTLLRMMAGISPPTAGEVTVHGRYAALFDLGAGFHPQATGRENAYLNALFMGLPKDQARALVPEIIEFSGLQQFADQQMRTYSSGMYLRLGFSVAVHVQPEILLIDEVIAVGDADFQQKCFDHFVRLKERSTTIVLVTHSVGSLLDFADRVILLERGRVVRDGDPEEVVRQYVDSRVQTSPAVRRHFERALGPTLGTGSDDAARDPEGFTGSVEP
jgi:ABC-type polysaccharide/polyol phosphate transport system ATPase subunit